MAKPHLEKNLYFSDGAFLAHSNAAWAVVKVLLVEGHIEHIETACSATHCQSSIDAEAIAALEALRWMQESGYGDLYCDNRSVIYTLQDPARSTEYVRNAYQECLWLAKLGAEMSVIKQGGHTIKPIWIKSHQALSSLPAQPRLADICKWGNAQADLLASRASRAARCASDVVDCMHNWSIARLKTA